MHGFVGNNVLYISTLTSLQGNTEMIAINILFDFPL